MSFDELIKITYDDSEVKVFHKHIEALLIDYLRENTLESRYEVLHHPSDVVGTIPDFVIVDKLSKKWVYVIEIKRTPGSVRSIRSWNQARDYVRNNYDVHWLSTSKPYFLLSNIEKNLFFCNHPTESTQFCLLQNGEESCSKFGDDATKTLTEFKTKVLPKIFKQLETQDVAYANNLLVILNSLVGFQFELTSHILNNMLSQVEHNPQIFGFSDVEGYTNRRKQWFMLNEPRSKNTPIEKFARAIARDCLLRVFIYEYNREFFQIIGTHTLLRPINFAHNKLKNSMHLSLEDLEKIDFIQIIRTRLIDFVPENMDEKTLLIFSRFLQKVQSRISEAIKESGSVIQLMNSIMENEDLYPRDEIHTNGKIMTDPELADLATFLCFSVAGEHHPPQSIFDPCMGTGNLLNSCYDRIKSKFPYSHNEILSHLHGSESDEFLGKLGIFGLIMRSPKEITTKTSIDIQLHDFFEIASRHIKKHDMVIMNPPFLRNDSKVAPLERHIIEEKIKKSFGMESFMKTVSQPNLFFYFVESATQTIKENGVCGYFVMQSVLNTENGAFFKKFLLENFEIKYIVMCPQIFFEEHQVSPCIIVGKRTNQPDLKNQIKFVQISSQSFSTLDYDILIEEQNVQYGGLTINLVHQKLMKPNDDWKEILLDKADHYSIFQTSDKFAPIGDVFTTGKRGELGNEGNGSIFFFPWSKNSTNRTIKVARDSIEPQFKKMGLEHSDVQNNYVLTTEDLTKEPCLSIPKSTKVSDYSGLTNFINEFNLIYKRPRKWHTDGMINNAQIIIPRSSRKVYSILLNPYWDELDVYFSTNFVCFNDCQISIDGVTPDEMIYFIAGYLNSSFGQMFFEVNGQNREGMRKIETKQIKKMVRVPITGLEVCVEELKDVMVKFCRLDYGITGLMNNESRHNLDLAVAKILWIIEPRFHTVASSPEDLANKSRCLLQRLLRTRFDE